MIAQFEQERTRLRAIAHRMLGSFAEADDALQEAWLKIERADTSEVENPQGWLTTVVARVCLNMLRDRREHAFEMPDPVIDTREEPEHQAVARDEVGLAMLIVLDTLKPDERLAFVLHDMFAVPFEDIAPLIDKTPAATRQLASRARKRVQDRPQPNVDLPKQREVVNAFLKASREGDLEGLVSVLHPDVTLKAGDLEVIGGRAVAGRASTFRQYATMAEIRPALIGGEAGFVSLVDGVLFSAMAFTVRDDKIVAIHVIQDKEQLAALVS
ncbi:sigma-70 family RNA polymerase sigma factor [Lentzea flava]|uniref:DNA-directed RNA polymerase sigma-70 factor n=1 Tax=Lentzea flava TaxID=103732 RepID=A0ABQ2UH61_9PSEU|nr:sigma-70 family RNA polymerase sigma factor [Lentzea flava]MCP2199183.1 RNA polymerase, sigma subunit, ECF family [Lentzea flava]GGU33920.1 DNA-directed RNA polymerase sigma-70 factor [Lentzea flava]